MRKALVLSLLAIVLGGCASEPARRDISGVWINQAAIDAILRDAGVPLVDDYGKALKPQ